MFPGPPLPWITKNKGYSFPLFSPFAFSGKRGFLGLTRGVVVFSK